jgi:hypothetical protein
MVAHKISVSMSVSMSVMVVVAVPVEAYIKVRQHKEPRKPDIPPPERIRHPAIKVCIVRWRGIVGDHGGTLLVIVTLHYPGVRIVRGSHSLIFGRGRSARRHGQAVRCQHIPKRLHGCILCQRYSAGVRCLADRGLKFTDNIRRNRVIGDPAVSGGYAGRT